MQVGKSYRGRTEAASRVATSRLAARSGNSARARSGGCRRGAAESSGRSGGIQLVAGLEHGRADGRLAGLRWLLDGPAAQEEMDPSLSARCVTSLYTVGLEKKISFRGISITLIAKIRSVYLARRKTIYDAPALFFLFHPAPIFYYRLFRKLLMTLKLDVMRYYALPWSNCSGYYI